LKLSAAILFLSFVLSQQTAVGQQVNFDPGIWAKKLASTSDKNNSAYCKLDLDLQNADSTATFNFLDKLIRQPSAKGHYFMARYNSLKAQLLFFHNPPEPAFSSNRKLSIKNEITALFESAMNHAYITDDDYLTGFVSGYYGSMMSDFQNTSKAVMYMMYSAELFEKVKFKGDYSATVNMVLGEMLWHIREYEKCIHYSKIALANMPDYNKKPNEMMCENTIGLAYHRMGQYDSAMLYYEMGIQKANEIENKKFANSWKGIISGNVAQIDFAKGKYQQALSLFMMGYQSSNENKYYDDAANSLQWAAKTNLVLGNKTEALNQIREAFQLLLKWPKADNYRQNAYQTASEIFKSLGNNDSALYYSVKYNLLHDSLEKVIYQSSLNISQLRLNNEKNKFNIQSLERSKNDQIVQRNYIIGAVLLFGSIILLIINRQRQKSKHKGELEHSENIRMEGEMIGAKAQMEMFTRTIVEKTALIEKLYEQEKNNKISIEEQDLIKVLSEQTILTDEEWIRFKILFEKIHPHFFEEIQKHINGLTQSEQRMAALTLLQLTTRQMAAVLGISASSVMKAKLRLRKRFDMQTDLEMETFLSKLSI
jgi:tetratricopeptide (TPR) repeat protein/DNA-binding CsgD family transcriptional regulator